MLRASVALTLAHPAHVMMKGEVVVQPSGGITVAISQQSNVSLADLRRTGEAAMKLKRGNKIEEREGVVLVTWL